MHNMRLPFIFLLLGLLSCSTQSEPSSRESTKPEAVKPDIQEIDVASLHQKIQQTSITLLDVRTPGEFAKAHVPTAQSIPLQSLSTKLPLLKLDKSQEIFLICAAGSRSLQAAKQLRQLGYLHVINVRGGTRGWQKKGYLVE